MMNKPQIIECPNCKTPIYFDVNGLMQGVSFTCSNCNCSISMASSSSQVVKKTMNKFEELKVKSK